MHIFLLDVPSSKESSFFLVIAVQDLRDIDQEEAEELEDVPNEVPMQQDS